MTVQRIVRGRSNPLKKARFTEEGRDLRERWEVTQRGSRHRLACARCRKRRQQRQRRSERCASRHAQPSQTE
jgi:hypothetical protein